MSGFLGEEQVRRVKEAVDLVEIFSDYTQVSRAGRQFKALCPFHDERTPSCYIYVDQQTYHCFGCGAHGDVITLLRERENCEFIDAVEQLAKRAGIELTYEKTGKNHLQRGVRDRLQQIMERSTAFYERQLWETDAGAAARAYLAERGLSEAVCRLFRLGWAPGHGSLVRAARSAGFDAQDLVTLDLAYDRDGRMTDRFFDRLTFPICDRFGHPIAFSARLLPAAERAAKEAGRGVGKYVNTRDTPLYHKSDVVFNLHLARKPARSAQRLVVMEGPTDVMAAHQAGIEECVAVLGTAMTTNHARQLGRVAGDGRLILVFDGDSAGQASGVKSAAVCLEAGVSARVAVLPEGKDPAELLGSTPGETAALEDVLENARPEIEHFLRALAPRPYELPERERLEVLDKVLDALRPVTDTDLRDAYLNQAASWFNLETRRLQQRMRQNAPQPRMIDDPTDYGAEDDGGVYGFEDTGPVLRPLPELSRDRESILMILLQRPDLRPQAFDEGGLEPRFFPAPWSHVVATMAERPNDDHHALALLEVFLHFRGADRQVLRWAAPDARLSDGQDIEDPESVLAAALNELRLKAIDFDLQRLQHELKDAQQQGDQPRVGALFQELLVKRQEQQRVREGS